MKKKVLLGIIILAVSAMGIYLLLKVDFSPLKNVNPVLLTGLIVISFINLLIPCICVTILLNGMGYQVRLWQIFQIITGSGLVSGVSSVALGIPTRAILYQAALNIPLEVGSASIILESALYLIIMGIILVFPVESLWGAGAWVFSLVPLALGILLIVMVIVFPMVSKILPKKIFFINLSPILEKISAFRSAAATVDKIKFALAGLVLFIFYLSQGAMLSFLLAEFGTSIPVHQMMYAIVLSYLIGLISLIPMGIGTRDVTMVVLIERLGASSDTAAICALIYRLLGTVVPLIPGIISVNTLGLKQILQRKKSEDSAKSVNRNNDRLAG